MHCNIIYSESHRAQAQERCHGYLEGLNLGAADCTIVLTITLSDLIFLNVPPIWITAVLYNVHSLQFLVDLFVRAITHFDSHLLMRILLGMQSHSYQTFLTCPPITRECR